MERKGDNVLVSIIYAYVALPILLLLFGWYKLYISIPCSILLVLGICYSVRNKLISLPKDTNILSSPKWIAVMAITFIWVYLSGIGGFAFQNGDFDGRNAIFHDLVNFPWPVKYDYSSDGMLLRLLGKTGMMDYYFAFWLPAALVGKFFGWGMGNTVLLLWTWFGVLIVYYLISRILGRVSLIAAAVMIFWSGLDIIGYLVVYHKSITDGNLLLNLFIPHKEWWSGRLQYSAVSVQLYWVFNQALPAWLITYLVLNQRNMKCLFFTAFLLIPYGPLPFIGMVCLLIYVTIFGAENLNIRIFEQAKFKFINILQNIRQSITPANIMGVLLALPLGLFFTLNKQDSMKGLVFSRFITPNHAASDLFSFFKLYLAFCLLEFLLYVLSLYRMVNRRLLIFCTVVLLIIPFFYFGSGNDFCMRASIPLLCILLVMTAYQILDGIKAIKERWSYKKKGYTGELPDKKQLKALAVKKYYTIAVVVLMMIGMFTPVSEICRSVIPTFHSLLGENINLTEDKWKTFSNSQNNEDYSKTGIITNYVIGFTRDNFVTKYLLK